MLYFFNLIRLYFICLFFILFIPFYSFAQCTDCFSYGTYPLGKKCCIMESKIISNKDEPINKIEQSSKESMLKKLIELAFQWSQLDKDNIEKKDLKTIKNKLSLINKKDTKVSINAGKVNSKLILINDIYKIQNYMLGINEIVKKQDKPLEPSEQKPDKVNEVKVEKVQQQQYKELTKQEINTFDSKWIKVKKSEDLYDDIIVQIKEAKKVLKGGLDISIKAFDQYKLHKNSQWDTELFKIQTKLSQIESQLKPILFQNVTLRNEMRVINGQINLLKEQYIRQKNLNDELDRIYTHSRDQLNDILYNHDSYVIAVQGYKFKADKLPESIGIKDIFKSLLSQSKLKAVKKTNAIFIEEVTNIKNKDLSEIFKSIIKEVQYGIVQQLDSSFRFQLQRFENMSLSHKEYWIITPLLIKPASNKPYDYYNENNDPFKDNNYQYQNISFCIDPTGKREESKSEYSKLIASLNHSAYKELKKNITKRVERYKNAIKKYIEGNKTNKDWKHSLENYQKVLSGLKNKINDNKKVLNDLKEEQKNKENEFNEKKQQLTVCVNKMNKLEKDKVDYNDKEIFIRSSRTYIHLQDITVSSSDSTLETNKTLANKIIEKAVNEAGKSYIERISVAKNFVIDKYLENLTNISGVISDFFILGEEIGHVGSNRNLFAAFRFNLQIDSNDLQRNFGLTPQILKNKYIRIGRLIWDPVPYSEYGKIKDEIWLGAKELARDKQKINEGIKWRLPKIKELQRIWITQSKCPHILKVFTDNHFPKDLRCNSVFGFWSDDEFTNENNESMVKVFDFNKGKIINEYSDSGNFIIFVATMDEDNEILY